MKIDKEELFNNPSFCIMPWIHQYINTTGDVYPCCTAKYDFPLGNVRTNTIEEVWNSEEYKQLRLNMLQGKKSPHCETCYIHENATADDQSPTSFRQWANRDFEEFITQVEETNEDGSIDEMKLRYFDVRWSNICNFKCRTCGDWFSSAWAQEAKANWEKDNPDYQVFIKATNNNDQLLEQFKPHLPFMKVVYFAGGEPLITPEHYKILDFLIENNSTEALLRYNSNVSVLNYKSKNIIDYWKHFKEIDLYASIDSWGKRAEYIRSGTNWDEVVFNLTKIKNECPNVKIEYNAVVGLWNCMTITDFLEDLEDRGLFDPLTSRATLYRQITPSWQSLKHLPLELRATGIDKINNYIKQREWNISGGLVDRLNEIKEYMAQPLEDTPIPNHIMKSHIDTIDRVRNELFVETFPELRSWYESL